MHRGLYFVLYTCALWAIAIVKWPQPRVLLLSLTEFAITAEAYSLAQLWLYNLFHQATLWLACFRSPKLSDALARLN